MNKTIFSENGTKKVRLENAVYASTKNANQVNFNAVEIFDVAELPIPANINHGEGDNKKVFSLIWEKKYPVETRDGVAYFSADVVIDDPELVENVDKIRGLSPEVYGGEFFEKDGQCFYSKSGKWKKTAVILDPQVPAMKGADKVKKTVFSTNAKIEQTKIEEPEKEEKESVSLKQIAEELKETKKMFAETIEMLKEQKTSFAKKQEEEDDEKTQKEIKEIEKKLTFAKTLGSVSETSKPHKLESDMTADKLSQDDLATLKNLI